MKIWFLHDPRRRVTLLLINSEQAFEPTNLWTGPCFALCKQLPRKITIFQDALTPTKSALASRSWVGQLESVFSPSIGVQIQLPA